MKLFLPQVINNKKHTKTACSSRASVQYVSRKFLQFYKGYFTNFYQIKALTKSNFVNFLEIFAIL